jgi:drug/metabolite transporter (DMT)-like permease
VYNAKIRLISSMLIFGSIGIFVKWIPLPPTQIAFARGIIGSITLTIAFLLLKQKINWVSVRGNLPFLIGSGCIFGYNWIFLFKAYQYTTIANATLSYYCAPIIIVLLSPVIFKERLTLIKGICILSAIAGMLCITGTGDLLGDGHFIGIAYGLIAASLYAGVIIINKFLKDLPALESTLFQLAITSVAMMPYVFLSGRLRYAALDISGWILLIIIGIIHTGFAFILFFPSIQKLSGQTTAILSYIDPVSAIAMSWIVLHEKMNALQIVGGLLIIGAAFVSELTGKRKEYVK